MMKRRKMTHDSPPEALADVNEQELAKDTGARYIFEDGEPTTEQTAETERKGALDEKTEKNDGFIIISKDTEDIPLPTPAKERAGEVPVESAASDGTQQPPREEQTEKRQAPPPQPPKRRHKSGALYVAVILLCLVLSVGLIVGAAFLRRGEEQTFITDTQPQKESSLTTETDAPMTGTRLSAEEIYARGVKSSVSVAATANGETEYYSGFCVFSGGYVATLCEAVDGKSSVEIMTWDGGVFPATVVGADRSVNLALLKTDADMLEGVSVGASSSLCEGNSVFAIGNVGGGRYASSLLATQIAYRERQPLVECCDGIERRVTAIQLGALDDSALKGCPIFDTYGQAVAITLATATDGQASLAIPLDRAIAVLDVMRAGGTPSEDILCSLAYTPPKLGILGEQAQAGAVWGVRIIDFTDSASDSAAKLRVNDLVWRINDAAVTDTASLREQTEKYRVGESVEVFVLRGGQALSFYVVLE